MWAPTPGQRRRPLTDELRDAIIRELLLSGEVPEGDSLPTEAALCERYGASRVTVRAALRSLQETGYITTRHGRGSLVLPRPHVNHSGIDQLRSFDNLGASQGCVVETADLEFETVNLDAMTAATLGVKPGTEALVTRRVKVSTGVRIGWIVDYVTEGVLPFSVIRREFDGSVLDVLLAHPETQVEYSDSEIVPVALGKDIATRLGVRRGSPALHMNEFTCTSSGRILSWSRSWLLPEKVRYFLRRRKSF